ncbi:DNA clamp loader [Cryptococcus deuterogattii 99/473]|uniref:DNA clamp loader n=1 Tax=Cryptococcus deuterogattii Ram5 TaxID=1296110 RepID=A0A0D0TAG0_9TREE|nr:DNA clamp loader [Cryptococcus deuterogattii Ram5]KIY56363.1 DNA clamp loader [Cryptococcus deuterogattii 99/473]
MAGPAKRTRHHDENSASPADSTSSTPAASAAPTATDSSTPAATPPTTRANPASRRPATRSTQSNNTLFTVSTRQTNSALHAAGSMPAPSGSGMRGVGRAGVSGGSGRALPAGPSTRSGGSGMLLRTQSAPVIASPAQIKAAAGAGGGEAAPPKGGHDGLGLGERRFGKGKENIPPKKDEDQQPEPARKRMRVTSRGSYSGQGVLAQGFADSDFSSSGSRHSSLAPSSFSSSSISGWGGPCFPSPSPSQACSFDASPFDRLSVSDKAGHAVAHTSSKNRPVTRSIAMLPTPPPSTPPEEVAAAADVLGLGLVLETLDASDAETEKAPANPYKQLKSFLRLSTSFAAGASIDETIIGRQEEKSAIRAYISTSEAESDVGMYVSGPPGTGKTALVTAIGRELADDGWKVVEIGCMGMKATDMWKEIGGMLSCGKTEKDIKEYMAQEENKVLIILDEVDSLMPPPPAATPPAISHLFAKLFALPLTSSTTKLIAISNTLDLTIRARLVLPNSMHPQVLPFKAYGQTEMSAIVNARVNAAKVEGVKVDTNAITLLGKKVEAQNGDLRMCLGVLGSAISLAEAEWTKKISQAANDPEPKPVAMTKVAVSHILKALTSYTTQLRAAAGTSSAGSSSATGKKVKSVQLQGKMVLVAMLVYLSRTRAGMNGCPAMGNNSGTSTTSSTPTASSGTDIPAPALYATYSHLLSHTTSPFPPAPESDYRDLLSNLETLGLISLTSGSGSSRGGASASASKVGFCVREEDVKDGLWSAEGKSKGTADEEVKKIWEREEAKVKRVREKKMALVEADNDM